MVGRINLLLSPEFFFVEENWLIIKTFISTLSEEEWGKSRRGVKRRNPSNDVVGKTGKKKGVSFLQIRTHTKKLCELRKWTRVVKMPKTSPHPISFFFLPPSILWLNTQCSFPTLYREKKNAKWRNEKVLYSLKNVSFYKNVIEDIWIFAQKPVKHCNFCRENSNVTLLWTSLNLFWRHTGQTHFLKLSKHFSKNIFGLLRSHRKWAKVPSNSF